MTIANVIAATAGRRWCSSHNKTLAAQLYGELRELLPAQRGRVLHLVLRLLPAGSVRPHDRHVHREGRVDQRGHRRLRLRATSSLMERDDVIIVATVSRHLRTRRSGRVPRADGDRARGAEDRVATTSCASLVKHPVLPQRRRVRARHVPRARRHGRDLPGVRGAGRARRDVGRRDRAHLEDQRADRRDDRRARARRDLSREAFRHPARRRSSARWQLIRAELAERLAELQGRRQAARGAAARIAHELRHRDDARDRHVRGHRELLAPLSRPREQASGRPACSTISPTTSSSSSTSRTSRCRRSAECSTATARAS